MRAGFLSVKSPVGVGWGGSHALSTHGLVALSRRTACAPYYGLLINHTRTHATPSQVAFTNDQGQPTATCEASSVPGIHQQAHADAVQPNLITGLEPDWITGLAVVHHDADKSIGDYLDLLCLVMLGCIEGLAVSNLSLPIALALTEQAETWGCFIRKELADDSEGGSEAVCPLLFVHTPGNSASVILTETKLSIRARLTITQASRILKHMQFPVWARRAKLRLKVFATKNEANGMCELVASKAIASHRTFGKGSDVRIMDFVRPKGADATDSKEQQDLEIRRVLQKYAPSISLTDRGLRAALGQDDFSEEELYSQMAKTNSACVLYLPKRLSQDQSTQKDPLAAELGTDLDADTLSSEDAEAVSWMGKEGSGTGTAFAAGSDKEENSGEGLMELLKELGGSSWADKQAELAAEKAALVSKHSYRRSQVARDKLGLSLERDQTRRQTTVLGREMAAQREALPVFAFKEQLLEAIANNQVVVVSGDTGSGKSTQVPQFVIESEIALGRGGNVSVLVTEPRRISALSLAKRVAQERCERVGDVVGYKVRNDVMVSHRTRLAFCTAGVLLRRLLSDPNLEDVSHVFLDEVHERSVETDFLLIALKDVLDRRPSLRLVLMSATVQADKFTSYFSDHETACVSFPGRTFEVQQLYLEDFLHSSEYKVHTDGQRVRASYRLQNYQKGLASEQEEEESGAKGPDSAARSAAQAFRKSGASGGAGGGGSRSTLTSRNQEGTMRSKPKYAGFGLYRSHAWHRGYQLNKEDFRLQPSAMESLTNWMDQMVAKADPFLIAATVRHIHRTEGEGAVLVLLPGWSEINQIQVLLTCGEEQFQFLYSESQAASLSPQQPLSDSTAGSDPAPDTGRRSPWKSAAKVEGQADSVDIKPKARAQKDDEWYTGDVEPEEDAPGTATLNEAAFSSTALSSSTKEGRSQSGGRGHSQWYAGEEGVQEDRKQPGSASPDTMNTSQLDTNNADEVTHADTPLTEGATSDAAAEVMQVDNPMILTVPTGLSESGTASISSLGIRTMRMGDETGAEGEEAAIPVVDGMWVLPLHSGVAVTEQQRVFLPPPKGARKVILATNIAEVSITIPDVVYVVDTGRSKQTNYDPATRLRMLQGGWISKASAKQRSGRAGRVQPGVCYRLYPRTFHEDHMYSFDQPEMQRIPLEGLALQILSLGLGDPAAFLGQAMDPPEPQAVSNALDTLQQLGAIEPGHVESTTTTTTTTSLDGGFDAAGGDTSADDEDEISNILSGEETSGSDSDESDRDEPAGPQSSRDSRGTAGESSEDDTVIATQERAFQRVKAYLAQQPVRQWGTATASTGESISIDMSPALAPSFEENFQGFGNWLQRDPDESLTSSVQLARMQFDCAGAAERAQLIAADPFIYKPPMAAADEEEWQSPSDLLASATSVQPLPASPLASTPPSTPPSTPVSTPASTPASTRASRSDELTLAVDATDPREPSPPVLSSSLPITEATSTHRSPWVSAGSAQPEADGTVMVAEDLESTETDSVLVSSGPLLLAPRLSASTVPSPIPCLVPILTMDGKHAGTELSSPSSDGAHELNAEEQENAELGDSSPETTPPPPLWQLTPLGQMLALMPLDPAMGKMLIVASMLGVLDPMLSIAAGQSGRDPFVRPSNTFAAEQQLTTKFFLADDFGDPSSDHLVIASAYESYAVILQKNPAAASKYAYDNMMDVRALRDMTALRTQLAEVLHDAKLITAPPQLVADMVQQAKMQEARKQLTREAREGTQKIVRPRQGRWADNWADPGGYYTPQTPVVSLQQVQERAATLVLAPQLLRQLALQAAVKHHSPWAGDVELLRGVLVSGHLSNVAELSLIKRETSTSHKGVTKHTLRAVRQRESGFGYDQEFDRQGRLVHQTEKGDHKYLAQAVTREHWKIKLGSESVLQVPLCKVNEPYGTAWLPNRWIIYSNIVKIESGLAATMLSSVHDLALLVFAGGLQVLQGSRVLPAEEYLAQATELDVGGEEAGMLPMAAGVVKATHAVSRYALKTGSSKTDCVLALAGTTLSVKMPREHAVAILQLRGKLQELLQRKLLDPDLDVQSVTRPLCWQLHAVLEEGWRWPFFIKQVRDDSRQHQSKDRKTDERDQVREEQMRALSHAIKLRKRAVERTEERPSQESDLKQSRKRERKEKRKATERAKTGKAKSKVTKGA